MKLLLDEHLSPTLVEIARAHEPDLDDLSIYDWQEGAFTNQPDERILRAAAADRRTLVTFDVRTIPSILADFAVAGENHAGVIFVSTRTFLPNDLKSLGRALAELASHFSKDDWTNRAEFLTRD